MRVFGSCDARVAFAESSRVGRGQADEVGAAAQAAKRRGSGLSLIRFRGFFDRFLQLEVEYRHRETVAGDVADMPRFGL